MTMRLITCISNRRGKFFCLIFPPKKPFTFRCLCHCTSCNVAWKLSPLHGYNPQNVSQVFFPSIWTELARVGYKAIHYGNVHLHLCDRGSKIIFHIPTSTYMYVLYKFYLTLEISQSTMTLQLPEFLITRTNFQECAKYVPFLLPRSHIYIYILIMIIMVNR